MPASMHELAKLGQGAMLSAYQHHLDRQRYRRTVGYHCVQDKNATARGPRRRSGSGSPRHHDRASRSLSFSADRGPRRAARGSKKLPVQRSLTRVGDAGRLEDLAGAGDGPRAGRRASQVDLGPLRVRQLREHRPCPSSDVDHGAHRPPAAAGDVEVQAGACRVL